MRELLTQKEFDFIGDKDRAFILAFDSAMGELGYSCGGTIGNGYCWGRYMTIYTKVGVKSKKSYARVYIRDDDIVLRLYFSDVEKHADVIGQAPDYIKEAFTGPFASCDHCRPDCNHRKSYHIARKLYEVCDGKGFWFLEPDIERLPRYLELFTEFYPPRKKQKETDHAK